MPKIISSKKPNIEFKKRYVGGTSLFVKESVMTSMVEHAEEGYLENKEILGLMTGSIFKDEEGMYAVVEDVATSDLDADEASVRFKEGSFEQLFVNMDECKGDSIVGWYHSHLGIGCYLSDVDIRTHEGIFGKDIGFAMVIDPSDSTIAPFSCIDGKPQKVSMIILTN